MKEEWNLRGKSLADPEHCQRVALLLGRAARAAAPHVRAVDLSQTSMSVDGALCVAEALATNSTIMSLRCAAHPGTTGDRQHPLSRPSITPPPAHHSSVSDPMTPILRVLHWQC